MTRGPYAFVFMPFVLFGAGVGGGIPLFEFVWASYYGRRHIGAVRAAGLPLFTMIAVLGPILTGVYYDQSGNYDAAFLVLGVVAAAGALLVISAPTPPPKEPVGAPEETRPLPRAAPASAPAGGAGG